MFKSSLQANEVLLVVWICESELVENLDFLLASFEPGKQMVYQRCSRQLNRHVE